MSWSSAQRVVAILTVGVFAPMVTSAQDSPGDVVAAQIDATVFFDALIERYRNIESYLDVVEARYTTTRDGEDPHVVSSRLVCRVEDGLLRVEAASRQVREGLGFDVPLTRSPAVEALVLRYNLWLAPHMVLKFAEDPRREFRLGVPAGFRAEEASMEIDGFRERVRLVLVERTGPEQKTAPARFVLLVNPESMLIERVEGEQVLPDGAHYSTTLRITPREVEPSGASAPEA